MKKIILTSALLAVCSANIYGNNTSLPNMMYDNMYVKVEAFTGIGAQVRPSDQHYGETTFNGSVGVGFQAMEQVRAELLVSYLQGPEYTNDQVIMTSEGWVAFLNGHVETVDLGSAKLAVGAGLGVSWLESTITSTTAGKGKYANDFAFAWNLGANISFEATPEAAIELSYRYANYGMPGNSDAAGNRAWDSNQDPVAAGTGTPPTPAIAKGLHGEARASHNIGLGLRFNM